MKKIIRLLALAGFITSANASPFVFEEKEEEYKTFMCNIKTQLQSESVELDHNIFHYNIDKFQQLMKNDPKNTNLILDYASYLYIYGCDAHLKNFAACGLMSRSLAPLFGASFIDKFIKPYFLNILNEDPLLTEKLNTTFLKRNENVNELLLDYKSYFREKKIRPRNASQIPNIIKGLVCEQLLPVFKSLSSLNDLPAFDAYLELYRGTFSNCHIPDVVKMAYPHLVLKLYEDSEVKKTGFLKLQYLLTRDMPREEFHEHFISLNSLMSNILAGTSVYGDGSYHDCIVLCTKDKNYEMALTFCKRYLASSYNEDSLKTILHFNLLMKNFDDAIGNIKELKTLPVHKKGIKKPLTKIEEILLHLTGRDRELQELLLKKQERILEKRHARGELIKKIIEDQKLTIEPPLIVNSKKEQAVTRKRPTDNTLSNEGNEEVFLSKSLAQRPNEQIIPKEAKKKTRGVPNQRKPNQKNTNYEKKNINYEEKKEQKYQPVTIEQLIKGNPYKIFCKFFARYSENTSDSHVKISLKDVETLMDALDQDYNPSKAKGSHKKITFDPKKLGIGEESENAIISVLTLANNLDLLPYQIDDLRSCFLNYGLYPKALEETLKQKGLLDALTKQ